ncbi:hypothetical protein B0H14DRAFT_3460253 [Mycena olivaceomarginata]|nr:hypothetical protein B0H14DRAFT_3460253 [Mycena olivaceomarginata]
MPHQDPPLPSISLVLSQSTQPSYLVFPWTPISYQNPVVPAPINVVPVAPPQLSAAPTATTRMGIFRTLRQFLAKIITSFRAWITF